MPDLRYVPGLPRVGDGEIASLFYQLPVEGCHTCGGLHGHLLHIAGSEEVGYFLIGHSPLVDDLAVRAEDCRIG